MNYNAFCFGEKNGFKSIFSPILLSERYMGIDYIYNILDHENPYNLLVFTFPTCGRNLALFVTTNNHTVQTTLLILFYNNQIKVEM